jgi:hypothetical protein
LVNPRIDWVPFCERLVFQLRIFQTCAGFNFSQNVFDDCGFRVSTEFLQEWIKPLMAWVFRGFSHADARQVLSVLLDWRQGPPTNVGVGFQSSVPCNGCGFQGFPQNF